MEKLKELRELLSEILGFPLIHFGGVEVTIGLLVYIVLLFWLLIFLTGRIKKIFLKRFLRGSDADIGVRQAVATIVRYFIVVLGSFVILQTAGIDLSALVVVAGGLGIGIGFGLQNVISNFTSGLIILFERPIKVGDRIDVGGVTGDVTNISLRATTIRTNDNISILVPNSEFIDSRVTNWTYSDRDVRLHAPVGVSYSSDAVIELGSAAPHVDDRGGMVPLFIMPAWMQTVSDFSPAKWSIIALEGALWRKYSFPEMLPPAGILVGIGVVCFAMGVRAFRWSE